MPGLPGLPGLPGAGSGGPWRSGAAAAGSVHRRPGAGGRSEPFGAPAAKLKNGVEPPTKVRKRGYEPTPLEMVQGRRDWPPGGPAFFPAPAARRDRGDLSGWCDVARGGGGGLPSAAACRYRSSWVSVTDTASGSAAGGPVGLPGRPRDRVPSAPFGCDGTVSVLADPSKAGLPRRRSTRGAGVAPEEGDVWRSAGVRLASPRRQITLPERSRRRGGAAARSRARPRVLPPPAALAVPAAAPVRPAATPARHARGPRGFPLRKAGRRR